MAGGIEISLNFSISNAEIDDRVKVFNGIDSPTIVKHLGTLKSRYHGDDGRVSRMTMIDVLAGLRYLGSLREIVEYPDGLVPWLETVVREHHEQLNLDLPKIVSIWD